MGRDPDNWFDEPAVEDARDTRVDRIVREREDWLADAAPPAPRHTGVRVNSAVVLVAALAICLLLGILAAAGVFSGGGSEPSALTTTTAAQHPTTTPTTVRTTTSTQPTAVVVPTTPLKPGDTGSEVTQLQHALAQAGYSPGKADGSYGDATTQAVKDFQSAHALTADGIAGAQTLAALESALQSG